MEHGFIRLLYWASSFSPLFMKDFICSRGAVASAQSLRFRGIDNRRRLALVIGGTCSSLQPMDHRIQVPVYFFLGPNRVPIRWFWI